MPSPDEFVHAALECFHEDDFPETIRVCHRGLDQHPDTGRLWEILGLAHWMRGEIQAALSPLETASLYVPLQPLAQLALAAAYAWANKPDLARTVYKHLADCPGFPVPLMPRLAAGLGRIGENEAALLVCEKLVELRPDYHPAWFGIAFYRRRLGRPVHEATDPLTRAMRLAPDVEMYRLNLAACLAQAGDYPAAYRVAESIQVAGIDCPHWLQLMLPVFAWAGDDHRERECRIALDYLREDPDHDGPCSRCE